MSARRSPPSARHRVAWILTSQAISSLTNFLVSLSVARSVGLVGFGAFTVAITIYFFLAELVRPLALEPLLIRFTGADQAELRRAASAAAGVALSIAVGAGLIVIAVGFSVGGALQSVLLPVGLMMPGLLVQDACRSALFAQGRACAAALNDLSWGIGELLCIGGILLWLTPSAGAFVTAWGVTALLAALLGLVQLRIHPRLSAARVWIKEHRDLSPRFLAEYLVDSGSFYLTLLAVGLVGGLAALGALNGARVLLGPFGVVFLATSSIAITEGSRLRDAGSHLLVPATRLLAITLMAAAGLWGGALMLLTPEAGRALLGDTFVAARSVLPLLTVYWATKGAVLVAKCGLRVLGAARSSLRAMLKVAPVTSVAGILGSAVAGAVGAAAGLAIGSTVGVAVWWRHFEAAAGRFVPGGQRQLKLHSVLAVARGLGRQR